MKAGDRFTVNGKEYEAVKSDVGCKDCAFRDGEDCTDNHLFPCLAKENLQNKLIAKKIVKDMGLEFTTDELKLILQLGQRGCYVGNKRDFQRALKKLLDKIAKEVQK